MTKKLTLPEMTKRNETDNTNIVIENAETPFNDEIALLAVNELLDEKKIKVNSRIKPTQVSNLTKLYLFGEIFGVPACIAIADNILKLQISLNGYGRQELVQLVQQRSNGIYEKPITSKDIFK